MRIEIDTVHDSKEDLVHLANMLHALSANSPNGLDGSFTDDRFQRKLDKKLNRFHNSENLDRPIGHLTPSAPGQTSAPSSTPASGFMNIFGENNPSQEVQPSTPVTNQPMQQSPAPSQSSAGGDIFSIFGGAEETSGSQIQEINSMQPSESPTMQELLSESGLNEPEREDRIPEDVRLVPY